MNLGKSAILNLCAFEYELNFNCASLVYLCLHLLMHLDWGFWNNFYELTLGEFEDVFINYTANYDDGS